MSITSNFHFLTSTLINHISYDVFKVSKHTIDLLEANRSKCISPMFIRNENITGIPNSCSVNTIFNMFAANGFHFKQTGDIYRQVRGLLSSTYNQLGDIQDIDLIIIMGAVINCNIVCVCIDDICESKTLQTLLTTEDKNKLTRGEVYKSVIDTDYPYIYIIIKGDHYNLYNVTDDIRASIISDYYETVALSRFSTSNVCLAADIIDTGDLNRRIYDIRQRWRQYLSTISNTVLIARYTQLIIDMNNSHRNIIIKNSKIDKYIDLWNKDSKAITENLLHDANVVQYRKLTASGQYKIAEYLNIVLEYLKYNIYYITNLNTLTRSENQGMYYNLLANIIKGNIYDVALLIDQFVFIYHDELSKFQHKNLA